VTRLSNHVTNNNKDIEFEVDLPEVSFLKFQVFDKDFVSRDDIIAYAYIPFNHIQTGSEYDLFMTHIYYTMTHRL